MVDLLQDINRFEKDIGGKMMEEYKGKIVLITGGSSGIGEAVAKKMLQAGAVTYIMGRSEKRLAEAKINMEKMGGRIETVTGDVARTEDCKNAVQKVIDKEGRLDILVNSAGVYVEGPTAEMTEEQWDQTVDINLKGTFFMCQYGLAPLVKSKGCIVNVSSDAGLMGNKEAAIYCASKGGVTLLTKALAMEFAERGVRVNAVNPGIVETNMVKMDFEKSSFTNREEYDQSFLCSYPQGPENSRYVQPEEVAECILFLASKEKVEAITGACLSIDFGITAGY